MIYQHINGLIQEAIEVKLIHPEDHIYARNQVMNLLHLESFPAETVGLTEDSIPNLLDKIIAYAIENNVIDRKSVV